jgi:sulfoxide reductase heme-binding subunit YedZ
VSATLGVIHYWWLVKADIRRPLAYAIVVGSLLLFRIWWSRMRAPVTWKKTPDPVRPSV